jgi:uncharacterized membrane protein
MQRHNRLTLAIETLIILGMFAAGALLLNQLPSEIPSHWNAAGVVDGWMLKEEGIWLIPAIALLIMLVFQLLPRIDPKKENYSSFAGAWNIMQVTMVVFFAYVYSLQMDAALHPADSILVGRNILLGVGALFIVMGFLLPRIRQNFFIGIRTPWTISDANNWSKTHALGGKMFVIGGLLTLVMAWMIPARIFPFIIILFCIVLIPVAYSYVLFEKKIRKRK